MIIYQGWTSLVSDIRSVVYLVLIGQLLIFNGLAERTAPCLLVACAVNIPGRRRSSSPLLCELRTLTIIAKI